MVASIDAKFSRALELKTNSFQIEYDTQSLKIECLKIYFLQEPLY